MRKILLIITLFFLGCSQDKPKTIQDYKEKADAIMPLLNKCQEAETNFFQALYSGELSKLPTKKIKEKEAKLKTLQAKCKLARTALFSLDKDQYEELKTNPSLAKKAYDECQKNINKASKNGTNKDLYLKTLKQKHIKEYLKCKNAQKLASGLENNFL